jgi:RNA polymerase sigma-70 factor (ECF subfamily)
VPTARRPECLSVGRDDPHGPGNDLVDLLGMVARGDAAAFESVYDQVAPAVFGMVRRVLRDPGETEEVTQEVLLDVWRCASRYQPSLGSPTAWIMTIAHRRAVDRIRANQRAAQRNLPPLANDNEVVDTVELNLDHHRVRRCLTALSETQRESILLAYYGGYSYNEVAGLLKLPLGTVKTRMRDGLIRLRDCLEVGQ